MCSLLVAFRFESNLRKEAMRQIVRMPLGFFDLNTSGKIRKVIDDNAGITHSFLAHQMPDLAGSVLVPLTAVILIFTFDWKLGLVCIIPVAVAMFLMGHLMNTQGQAFMRAYMTSLEEILPQSAFFRIHKSFLVNLSHIDSIAKGRVFINGKELPVSALRREELLQTVVYKNLISK